MVKLYKMCIEDIPNNLTDDFDDFWNPNILENELEYNKNEIIEVFEKEFYERVDNTSYFEKWGIKYFETIFW